MTARTRITSNTIQRAMKAKQIIEALQAGEMRPAAMAKLIGVGQSGLRKYTAEMVKFGAINIVMRPDRARPNAQCQAFRIASDAKVVAAYLDTLTLSKDAPVAPTINVNPSRRVHVILDDGLQAAPMVETIKRDPMALPTGFFGGRAS